MPPTEPRTGMIPRESSTDDRPVWDRLRESMERLSAGRRQTTDPQALALKLAHRAEVLRASVAPAQPREVPLEFLAFTSGRGKYGIPLRDVIQIQALEHFSPVPRTAPFIAGVLHWRGAILALLDLGRLFGLAEAGLADVHACIIVEAAGRRVGLVACEIDEVHGISRHQIQTAPPLSGNVSPDWIVGIHDDHRVILNLASLLQDPRLIEWRKDS